jgi:Cu(I)/Ag(I) efflux system membrane fusion protein
MSLLGEAAHTAWMKQLPDLRQAARDLAAADSLDARRALLSPLTDRLVKALKTFGYERSEGQVGVFHCPMALEGEGADWLQQGTQTANPYYGMQMPRCGSRTEVLSQER